MNYHHSPKGGPRTGVYTAAIVDATVSQLCRLLRLSHTTLISAEEAISEELEAHGEEEVSEHPVLASHQQTLCMIRETLKQLGAIQ